jgi:TrmH family RNA methyltransferase
LSGHQLKSKPPMSSLSDSAAHQLRQVCVVLVCPSQPRNIGAVARAMKCMGLRDLRLVRPARFPDPQANALAVNAADLLDHTTVHATLQAALVDVNCAYGVSARERRHSLPVLSVRSAAADVLAQVALGPVALVFGNEEAGLDNADLELCQQQLMIPSDPQCASLNLAAAVQVVCHELRQASLDPTPGHRQRTGVGRVALTPLLMRFDAALDDCGFYDNKNRAQAQAKLRAVVERARPDKQEMNLLLGMLAQLVRGGHPNQTAKAQK